MVCSRDRFIVDALERRTLLASAVASALEMDAARQRFRVDFDADVSALIDSGTLQALNLRTGQRVDLQSPAYDAGTNAARWAIDGATPYLPNGNYELLVDAEATSPALAAEHRNQTFFLRGDFNHDRVVNFADLLVLAASYNQSGKLYSQGDATYDGAVNFDDNLTLASVYGSTMTPAPTEATGLVADGAGTESTTLQWNYPFSSRTDTLDFAVFRSTDGVHFAYLADGWSELTEYWVERTPPEGETYFSLESGYVGSYTDENLTDGTKYWYRVRPFQMVDDDSDPNTPDVRELGLTTTKDWAVTTMKAPTDVGVTVAGDAALVRWIDNSASELHYLVRAQPVDAQGNPISTVQSVEVIHPSIPGTGGQGEQLVTGLVPNTRYRFTVTAVNAEHETPPIGPSGQPWVDTGNTILPTMTGSPSINGVAYNDNVTFSWPAAQFATGYEVQWSNGDGEWFTIDEVSETTATDEWPTIGGQLYRVVPVRDSEEVGRVVGSASGAMPVHPIAPPVPWHDDNAGLNERGTLSPYVVNHANSNGIVISPLGNDADYDGGTIHIESFTQPSNGTLTRVGETDTLTYVPNSDFTGVDCFTYRINDGQATSREARVAIDVTNSAPSVSGGKFDLDLPAYFGAYGWYWNEQTQQNEYSLKQFPYAGQVYFSDPDGDEVTLSVTDEPDHGQLTLNKSTGEFEYLPGTDFAGFDRFTVSVKDKLSAEGSPASYTIVSSVRVPASTWFNYTWAYSPGAAVPVTQDAFPVSTQPQHGQLTVQDGVWNYTADAGFNGLDHFSMDRGPFFNAKGEERVLLQPASGPDSPRWPTVMKFRSYVETPARTSFSNFLWDADSAYHPPMDGMVWSVAQGPQHGELEIVDQLTGQYNYIVPAPSNNEDPYVGWDFFQVQLTNQYGSRSLWVQINHSHDPGVAVGLPPAPKVLNASPTQIGSSFSAIQSGVTDAKTMLKSMLDGLKTLGEKVGEVANADDLSILSKLDGATGVIDSINQNYQQYINQLNGLNIATGKFLADQWYMSDADGALVQSVTQLPTDVGSFRASHDQAMSLAASLSSLGSGAGIAVDTANKIVVAAETTHRVLTTVEMAGGVTVLVKTGATLLVKEGIKACAKAAAKELVQETASGVAANLAGYAAELVGIPEEQRRYIQIGADAYQAFSFFKAAKTKVDFNGSCFAAGTQVIVGRREDGSYITKSIEDVQVGDAVLSRDQYDPNGDLQSRQVVELFRNTSGHERVLTIAGDGGNIETLRTTDEHPFWVQGKGWTIAGELAVGDFVQEADGSWQEVTDSERIAHADGLQVFNFEVAGDHTYFVADAETSFSDPVWVHNTCVGDKFVGTYKGKPVAFRDAESVTFTRTSSADLARINAEWPAAKQSFLSRIGTDAASKNQLRRAGMTEDEIHDMQVDGVLPDGWVVHHKQGRVIGGDNDFDNLMIVRKEDAMYHSVLTTKQGDIQRALEAGESVVERNFPMFTGAIIFNRDIHD